MSSTPRPLTVVESNELGAGLLAAFARELGIRVLLIKGHSFEHHGLRAPRTYGDVDIWVDPAEFEHFSTALIAAGGVRNRDFGLEGRVIRAHSHTFRLPWLACEVDVHEFFPGFLVPPQQSFDALWD